MAIAKLFALNANTKTRMAIAKPFAFHANAKNNNLSCTWIVFTHLFTGMAVSLIFQWLRWTLKKLCTIYFQVYISSQQASFNLVSYKTHAKIQSIACKCQGWGINLYLNNF